MPFIPHTEAEIREMLRSIGVSSIDQLFEEIPADLLAPDAPALPAALSEMEVSRLMSERAERDGAYLSFLGAGAYEHHIPAAVWQLATRGEFYTAYTPYQAEASQGTLQVLYEYQSMICALTGLEVTNASLYDGASALAEAVLMAVRAHKSSKRVLMPATVHPAWRKVVHSIVRNQGIELVPLPYCPERGHTLPDALPAGADAAAIVIPQPNFFGVLEPVDELTERAHAQGMRVIALVNPTALAVLKPPATWGERGADIAVGDGQPLGIPLASGGPYFGFMSCTKDLIRQMPGRLVGATFDGDGRRGYVLTLQAREQHIRRSKATSNICTNQGLMATAATIYMALLGASGLADVARASHANTLQLVRALTAVDGVERAFSGPVFHEAVLRLKTPLMPVLNALKAQGILGGLDLVRDYPELGPALLVCATETKSAADIERYATNMAGIIGKHFRPAPSALEPEIKSN